MKKIIVIVGFILTLVSPHAFSDIASEMDGWVGHFSDPSKGLLGNVTVPQASMNASRGVITGGSIAIRSRVKNVNLYNIDPPTIRAGCGGIDIYNGSFSFISKDEFVALLRAVGQNAVGYAFQIALDSYCGTCMKWMSELASKLNNIMSGMANSCETALFCDLALSSV